MPKFRNKPVVIEANQWFKNGDHPLDYSKDHDGFENGELRTFTRDERKSKGWEGDIVRYYRTPAGDGKTRFCEKCGVLMHDHGWIDNSEEGHTVCPADWIVTNIEGEHCPLKPDIFEQTYELA